MNGLARAGLRGRWGQVVALGATLGFAATLLGAFGVLLETGVRGTVSTGEYAAPPVVLGAPQTLSVAGDVDAAVTGRATLPAEIVTDLRAVGGSTRVVADHVVPAVLTSGDGEGAVTAHPWSAFALGDRRLAAGRGPEAAGEVVLPAGTARTRGLDLGDAAVLGFGERGRRYTLVGTTAADDAGADRPDAYLADVEAARRSGRPDRVAAVGVWPADERAAAEVRRIAAAHGAREWSSADRGGLEVVGQWSGRQALVSIGGAAGGLAAIVALFTIAAITSLQVRERARELALLRVLGATPAQVRRLLRSELRWVAVVAAAAGSALGPVLGVLMVRVAAGSGIAPATLQPVLSPLPVLVAVGAAVATAEVAGRLAGRRVSRGSPLAAARGDDGGARRGMPRRRWLLGLALLAVGGAMVAAPAYDEGEAAQGLPSLSGLVVAVALAVLGPAVVAAMVRLAGWVARLRSARPSAEAHLALAGIQDRAARVAGALSPLVLGVTLAIIQLFSMTTMAAVGEAQVEAGRRADLTVTSTGTGVGEATIDALRGVPEVASVQPVVSTPVNARGPAEDAGWQPQPALGVEAGPVTYADLRPRGGGELVVGPGEVAVGSSAAAMLAVDVGDRLALVLPDGSRVRREVAAVYERDLGFGQLVLPIDDLRPATGTARPTGLAIELAPGIPAPDGAAAVAAVLDDRPGLATGLSPVVGDGAAGDGEGALQLLLLLALFGYIAIAVANSVAVATLARGRELALLRAVGATPAQLRRLGRAEGLFLAAAACLLGTAAAVPGLAGLAHALSHGERTLPGIDPLLATGIAAATFALALAATGASTRLAVRAGAGRPGGGG